MHSTHSACKSRERDYVTLDQLRRVKARINTALTTFGELIELCRARDQVLGESLLATQKSKNNQLICKKEVHENLITFMGTMQAKENIKDLLLPLEDYDSTGAFGGGSEKSGKRRSRSTGKKGKKRSRSQQSRTKSSRGPSERSSRNRLAGQSDLGSKSQHSVG